MTDIYQTIQPPFTLRFKEMSKVEIRGYFTWFLDVIPERIEALTSAVRATSEYQSWAPDCGSSSLSSLGAWMIDQMATEPMNPVKKAELDEALPEVPVDEHDLTPRSYSICMDAGMYWSQVLRAENPLLEWSSDMASRSVDFGQPVLRGDSPVLLNPVRLALNIGFAARNGEGHGESLIAMHEAWRKLLAGT